MSVAPGNGSSSGLIGRVTGLITRPRSEWEVIDPEHATTQGLYTGYVMILAAIPAILGLITTLFLTSVLGSLGGVFGVAVGISPIFAIVSAVINYGLSLAMVYVLALLINAFAPSFGAARQDAGHQGGRLCANCGLGCLAGDHCPDPWLAGCPGGGRLHHFRFPPWPADVDEGA